MLGKGQISVYEVDIPEDFEERPIPELRLPRGALLVAVVRGDEVTVPTATTHIQPGDQVTAVSNVELEDEVRDALGYAKGRRP